MRKVVAKAPEDVGARERSALTYLRARVNQRLALEAIEAALRRTPDDTALLADRAEAALASGNVAKDGQLYERADSARQGQHRPARSGSRRCGSRLAIRARAPGPRGRWRRATRRNIRRDMALIVAYIQRKELRPRPCRGRCAGKSSPTIRSRANMRGAIYMAKRDFKGARKAIRRRLDAQPKDFASAYHGLARFSTCRKGKARRRATALQANADQGSEQRVAAARGWPISPQ